MYFSYRYDYSQNEFYSPNTLPKHDFGYIYSAGFSYPITNNVKAFIDGRYTSGRRIYIDPINGRNGTSELVFGIGYNGFWNKKMHPINEFTPDSSSRQRLVITYKGGYSGSNNSGQHRRSSYSTKGGTIGGVSIDFFMNSTIAINTGLTFEQKGYQFKDSSESRFVYNPINYSTTTKYNNCKTDIDYIIIPLTLKLKFGGNLKYYFNFGLYSGLRLNARVTGSQVVEQRYEYGYSLSKYIVYDDIEGNIKDDDWGYVLGGGLIVPISKACLLEFGCNYNSGWKNILDVTSPPLSQGADKSLKNKSLNFTVGLQIPIL